MKTIATLATTLALALVATSCSMDVKKPGPVKIIIEDPNPAPAQLLSITPEFDELLGIAAVPTASSDFGCFAINVVGAGVPTTNLIGTSCTSNDNFHNVGLGLVSGSAQRGVPINLDLPPGKARSIHVYGIFPAPASCNGPVAESFKAYFLGGAQRDIEAEATVTIPISYTANTQANVTCINADVPPQVTFDYYVYVVDNSSNDINRFRMDGGTGVITSLGTSLPGTNPTSVAISPDMRFLYVANSTSNNISAFTIDPPTGNLSPISGSPFAAGGNNLFSVKVHPSGKFLYTANYNSNTVSGFAINAASGALTAISGSPWAVGTNPSAVALDAGGGYLYAANQGANTISGFSINTTTGVLTATSGSPYAAGVTQLYGLAISPTNLFLYVAGQTSNNVGGFSINPANGVLTAVSGSPFAAGTTPTPVAIDPNGRFVYVGNGGSNNVTAYSINTSTGSLTAISGSPFAAGTSPQGLAVDPTSRFLYVANQGSNNNSGFQINQTNGALTAISGSPFSNSGLGAYGIAFAKIAKPF